ncbi:MAG: hypothetical protein AAFN78_12245 [Pseudomonadota bacterium]
MSDTSRTVTIEPSYWSALLGFLLLFGFISIVVMLKEVLLGHDPLDNMVKYWTAEETIALLAVASTILLVAYLFVLVGSDRALDVNAKTISGRATDGQRVSFPTASVTEVEYVPTRYVRSLRVHSSESPQPAVLILNGIKKKRTAARLASTIGSAHPLTQWFQGCAG